MNITIIGGGTAGWIAAYIIAKRQSEHNISVIESSSIPIIGVGEGVTGKFTDLFNDPILNLDEFEFLQKTWALPKYGIKFSGWTQDISKEFYSPIEGSVTESYEIDTFLYSSIYDNQDIALSSISGHYYKKDLIPWYIKDDNIFWVGGKAYHIDAYKVGEFFKEKCLEIGVIHIDAKVTNVFNRENIINSIELDNDKLIESDFFIDCSGFAKVLFSKLSTTWVDKSDSLPVDRALIFKPLNYKNIKKSYTSAIAKKYGWVFEIPTRYKIGRGYIFSTKFADENTIIKEIEESYGPIEVVKVLKFQSGRFENTWVGNCISLGLASGFLEPLQATSLHVTICQINTFVKNYLMNSLHETINETFQRKFNSYIKKLTEELLDFVQVTYLGGRDDTDFWRFMNNESVKSERLKDIIEISKARLLRFNDFDQYDGYAGQAIWVYTLAGLGYFKKSVIEQTFKNYKIDLHQIKIDREIFNEQMQPSLNNMLTIEQLNEFLINGEKSKLIKIF